MGDIVRYLSHPQVIIDPDVPIPDWGLSEEGARRVMSLTLSPVLGGTKSVISSPERKAVETAEPLAAALMVALEIHPRMHENDRSATGYLPPERFEATADAFFASPTTSVDGWERAVEAQARICSAVEEALRQAPPGDVLLVGHGAVGTLLMCATAGWPISREYDQTGGGGNCFAFTRESREVLHGWEPMEYLRANR